MQETWVQSLGWEDPLEEGKATHCNILAWEIPWAEEPDGVQSLGSKKSQTRLNDEAQHSTTPWHSGTLWISLEQGMGLRDTTDTRKTGAKGCSLQRGVLSSGEEGPWLPSDSQKDL